MESRRESASPTPPGPASKSRNGSGVNRLWPALLPELKQFPECEREQVLKRARETALDLVELVCMALGLVAVTALTKFGAPDPYMDSRFAPALINFALAMPLLVAVLGPFHMRRLRRGLRIQLRDRDRG